MQPSRPVGPPAASSHQWPKAQSRPRKPSEPLLVPFRRRWPDPHLTARYPNLSLPCLIDPAPPRATPDSRGPDLGLGHGAAPPTTSRTPPMDAPVPEHRSGPRRASVQHPPPWMRLWYLRPPAAPEGAPRSRRRVPPAPPPGCPLLPPAQELAATTMGRLATPPSTPILPFYSLSHGTSPLFCSPALPRATCMAAGHGCHRAGLQLRVRCCALLLLLRTTADDLRRARPATFDLGVALPPLAVSCCRPFPWVRGAPSHVCGLRVY